jgi:hypothetical protein
MEVLPQHRGLGLLVVFADTEPVFPGDAVTLGANVCANRLFGGICWLGGRGIAEVEHNIQKEKNKTKKNGWRRQESEVN